MADGVTTPAGPAPARSGLVFDANHLRSDVAGVDHLRPRHRSGWGRLAASVLPLAALLAVGRVVAPDPWFWSVAVALVAAVFWVRTFLVLHDCAHNSLVPSRRCNAIVGTVCGFLTATPFVGWRRRHLIHHATSSNLDRRGWWDFPIYTVEEYGQLGRAARCSYRVLRSPLVLLGVAPVTFFLVVQRLPAPGASRRERTSVHLTTATSAILAVAFVRWYGIGPGLRFLLVGGFVAGGIGFFLFYSQHNGPEAWWARRSEWTFDEAALRGSYRLELPLALDWATAYIGHHDLHHLLPGVPSYRLPWLQARTRFAEPVPTMSITGSLQALRYHLWDESLGVMVGWGAVRS